MGVDAQVLAPERAAEIVPGISLDGVVGATFCPEDGLADPAGLTQGYATLARRAGAEVALGSDVRGVIVDGGRVTGVRTASGDVAAPLVVNAAGPWAGV